MTILGNKLLLTFVLQQVVDHSPALALVSHLARLGQGSLARVRLSRGGSLDVAVEVEALFRLFKVK